MSPQHELLSLRGVSKHFGRVIVATDLDLSVADGEALGIVGPNGAGKSTLFSMISGDLRPDAGTVWFDGNDVTGAHAYQRTRAGIGRTYQIPRPFENLTVFESVLVCCHQGGGRRGRDAADRAADILERTGLRAEANTAAGRLGLLQRKRLEMARALGTDPKLLLLDEVAGGLTDPEVAELVEVVQGIRADGLAVVWIEHVVHALVKTVDRMLCLAGGRIVADGSPLEVLANAEVRELYLGGGPESATADEETES
ncbi:ABC transporter ATP-binding protein [Nocardioides sp. CER19]|uniref:ABC transporter ATP-binding protein n=1 Tax=Nocardioides sp. CER19 TaxID=3038538 RepID=UPI0024470DED|nr:ABC transporter ATP-binding protein [Nocardioides sp. CER19]MDH2416305.1 ABC transporter ATP-binding protein [Nocardioides sp. CER19]